jgi:rare lipoprotein A
MQMVMKPLLISAAIATALAMPAMAVDCETETAAPTVEQSASFPAVDLGPSLRLLERYTAVESQHRLTGLASYYSDSLDGTLTANGERYHRKKLSAAHLTLPLGTWVEVRSKATGKHIRLRVNDRGPYVSKFCLDLSHAAAHALGVDVAEDRTVLIRILALPGQSPLPKSIVAGPIGVASEEAGW